MRYRPPFRVLVDVIQTQVYIADSGGMPRLRVVPDSDLDFPAMRRFARRIAAALNRDEARKPTKPHLTEIRAQWEARCTDYNCGYVFTGARIGMPKACPNGCGPLKIAKRPATKGAKR